MSSLLCFEKESVCTFSACAFSNFLPNTHFLSNNHCSLRDPIRFERCSYFCRLSTLGEGCCFFDTFEMATDTPLLPENPPFLPFFLLHCPPFFSTFGPRFVIAAVILRSVVFSPVDFYEFLPRARFFSFFSRSIQGYGGTFSPSDLEKFPLPTIS